MAKYLDGIYEIFDNIVSAKLDGRDTILTIRISKDSHLFDIMTYWYYKKKERESLRDSEQALTNPTRFSLLEVDD